MLNKDTKNKQTYMNEEQRRELKQAADESGLSQSSFIRLAVKEKINRMRQNGFQFHGFVGKYASLYDRFGDRFVGPSQTGLLKELKGEKNEY